MQNGAGGQGAVGLREDHQATRRTPGKPVGCPPREDADTEAAGGRDGSLYQSPLWPTLARATAVHGASPGDPLQPLLSDFRVNPY